MATQAGESRARWAWVEPCVWTDRMLTALEQGVKGGCWLAQRLLHCARAVLSGPGPCAGVSVLSQVTHQLESRMREIRPSGSEGGGANSIVSPYPYPYP